MRVLKGRVLKRAGAAVAATLVAVGMVSAPAGAATVLSIDSSSMYNGGRPCATGDPLPTLGYFANILQAAGSDTTGTFSTYTFTFQLWPTATPAEVSTITSTTFGTSLATGRVPASALVSGNAYSWRINVSDGTATSPWSQTCGFNYDTTAPAAPTVTSNYPPDSSTGPLGQLAQFTFDGGGDLDVAGFQYAWGGVLSVPGCESSGPQGQLVCPDALTQSGVVKATAPGRSATVSLNPPGAGPQELTVISIDVAGNISTRVSYQLFVPSSSPTVSIVGPQAICGSTATVKFLPHAGVAGITSYNYVMDSIDSPSLSATVPAKRDGTATVTVPVTPQNYFLNATSTSGNGFTSSAGYVSLDVNPQPTVEADVYASNGLPVGGIGVPGTFTFSPPSDGNWVSQYTYQFSHGKTHTVTADPNWARATVQWTPKDAGPQTLTVRSVNADGSGSSCKLTYTFIVANPSR